MRGTAAIRKAGTVVDVPGGPCPAWQSRFKSRVQRVMLIVVQEEAPRHRRREVRQAARYATLTFGVLRGISEVDLPEVPQTRRAKGDLPAANSRAVNGHWKKDVGVSQHIVIEEIP